MHVHAHKHTHLTPRHRYQKQLSDACFFVTRAIKGVNLLTEKLAAGAPNTAEMREKVNTLTTAVSEQLSKIMFILNEPLRELPPPVFDESELQEMASRYQMAFKELNDAYLRYVESFQHWQETRTRASSPLTSLVCVCVCVCVCVVCVLASCPRSRAPLSAARAR